MERVFKRRKIKGGIGEIMKVLKGLSPASSLQVPCFYTVFAFSQCREPFLSAMTAA